MGSTPTPGHRRARLGPRLLAAPAAALLVAGAAACGGPPGPAAPPAAATATGVPGSGSAAAGAPSPSPSQTSPLPSADQLGSALLTADDLGPAFVTPPEEGQSGSGSSTTTGCPALGDLLAGGDDSRPGRVHVETEFTTADATPYVGETLTTEDEAALTDEYGKAVQALTTCRSVTFTGSDGSVTFALTPTGLGGPGVSAVRMDGDLQGTALNGYLAVERVGPAFLTYWYLQVDSASSQLAAALYRQASDKAAQVLTGATPSPTAGGGAASAAV